MLLPGPGAAGAIYEALKRSEANYSRIVNTATEGIWVLGPDMRTTFVNARMAEMLGCSPEEVLGRLPTEFMFEEDVPDHLQRMESRRRGTSERYERRYRRVDGRAVWCLASGTPMVDEAGRFTGAFAMLADISDQKRAEEELEETARRKDEFMAMLGHELRNPLAPIRNASYILERLGSADPRARRAQEIIERQVSHISRIVDDLLDVSRIARGKISLTLERVDLVRITRMAIEDLRGELEASALSLTSRLPGEAVWVEGDATRLSQVVSNVVLNAIKFTDRPGRIRVEVLAPAAGGDLVTISVQDTGIGMTPETLARLFTPFEQADAGIARTRGGLGLALVKGLVSLHGGTVEATSEGLGRGSRVTIRLPALAAETARSSSAPELPAGKEISILVVEDNADAAASLQLLLELMGHRVRVATDGVAALTAARALRPEVIICDIGLPGGMDGYAVARAVRADPSLRAARLVALTGYGQARDRYLAQEAGFDAHMTKPANAATIERFLQGAACPSADTAGHLAADG